MPTISRLVSLVRNDRKLSATPMRMSVEHRLTAPPSVFDVYPQCDAREFCPTLGANLRNRIDRIEHVESRPTFRSRPATFLCPALHQSTRDDAAAGPQKAPTPSGVILGWRPTDRQLHAIWVLEVC